METSITLEIELLSELRGALIEHEVRSELVEDVAGLAVSTDNPDVCVWDFVSHGGRYFSWNRADCQHPVKDVAGAARRIAQDARGRGSSAGTVDAGPENRDDTSALIRRQTAALESEFPDWAISRTDSGTWAATRSGWGVVHGQSPVELGNRLRRYAREGDVR